MLSAVKENYRQHHDGSEALKDKYEWTRIEGMEKNGDREEKLWVEGRLYSKA